MRWSSNLENNSYVKDRLHKSVGGFFVQKLYLDELI